MKGGASFGIIVRFYTANQLVGAVRALEAQGWREWETFSPHPIEETESRMDVGMISRMAFIFGFFGFIAAVAMQVIPTFVLYPLVVGGQPMFSLPAFLPIAMESTLLFSAVGIFIALLLRTDLPCWHRSVFDLEEFRKVSRDAYFLAVYCKNQENSEKAARLLTQLGGEHIAPLSSAEGHEI